MTFSAKTTIGKQTVLDSILKMQLYPLARADREKVSSDSTGSLEDRASALLAR